MGRNRKIACDAKCPPMLVLSSGVDCPEIEIRKGKGTTKHISFGMLKACVKAQKEIMEGMLPKFVDEACLLPVQKVVKVICAMEKGDVTKCVPWAFWP